MGEVVWLILHANGRIERRMEVDYAPCDAPFSLRHGE
jgi:hypothetical protein